MPGRPSGTGVGGRAVAASGIVGVADAGGEATAAVEIAGIVLATLAALVKGGVKGVARLELPCAVIGDKISAFRGISAAVASSTLELPASGEVHDGEAAAVDAVETAEAAETLDAVEAVGTLEAAGSSAVSRTGAGATAAMSVCRAR